MVMVLDGNGDGDGCVAGVTVALCHSCLSSFLFLFPTSGTGTTHGWNTTWV